MKLRVLSIVWCVLVSAGSMLAQSGGTAADPMSGTWTGQMGPSGGTLNPVTMELKFDGTGAVSGTITGPTLSPGDIKVGTFDPKTGALKLEVTVKDGGNTVAFLEGTIVQGTATGRVNVGNQTGSFRITRSVGDAGAQPPGGIDAAAALRMSFDEVSGWVTKAAELVPADKYTYRPAQTVRTFGQLIAHVADAHNYYCARAAGRNVQWSDAIEKGSTDKATLAQKLKQSIDACNAVYGRSQAGPLFVNVGHTNLHYGNIITYVRMLGLVPPSS
jgi:uncharacterized damage-inducible protein DinB